MGSRLDLQELLEEKLGNNRVYFQPPSSLVYPCIIYEKKDYDVLNADDRKYFMKARYTITLIGKSADNDTVCKKLLDIPYCSFDRRFISDNLYHDVFNLYF